MATSVFLGVNEAVRPPPNEDLRSNCANPGFAPVVKACARPLEALINKRGTSSVLIDADAERRCCGGPLWLGSSATRKAGEQHCLSVRVSYARCKPVGIYMQETEPIGDFCARMHGLPPTCAHDLGSSDQVM